MILDAVVNIILLIIVTLKIDNHTGELLYLGVSFGNKLCSYHPN